MYVALRALRPRYIETAIDAPCSRPPSFRDSPRRLSAKTFRARCGLRCNAVHARSFVRHDSDSLGDVRTCRHCHSRDRFRRPFLSRSACPVEEAVVSTLLFGVQTAENDGRDQVERNATRSEGYYIGQAQVCRDGRRVPRPAGASLGSDSTSSVPCHLTYPRLAQAVPDDNSCLFRAVGLALASQERDASASLRKIVADTIRADSDTYSEAVLG